MIDLCIIGVTLFKGQNAKVLAPLFGSGGEVELQLVDQILPFSCKGPEGTVVADA